MTDSSKNIDQIRLQRVTNNLLEVVRYTTEHQAKSKTNVKSPSVPAKTPTAKAPVTGEQKKPSNPKAVPVAAVSDAPKKASDKKRPRAAIVAWDLSHNPAGRALVLYRLLEQDYSVDLIGPVWSRFGKGLWQPLRRLNLNVRSFNCADLLDFVPKAEFFANEKTYDLVYVSKPRLPSLFLGKLISLNSQCPLMVDVDDFELSFFANETYASAEDIRTAPLDALREPYEELATRYCQSLVSAADAVTVSNVALKRKFGGQLIRHARNSCSPKKITKMRESGRIRLNVAEDAFLLLFVGTPRPHKGVLEVARAVFEINDPKVVFHVVGTITDRGFINALKKYECPQVVFHNNCDFSDLPEYIAAADLVPLIQDRDHPISQFQIPAKISDATALGVPVLATRTPPVEDLILTGGVIETTHDTLREDIIQRIQQKNTVDVNAYRGFFNDELSIQVNRTRLRMAVADVENIDSSYNDELAEMVGLVRSAYASLRGQKIVLNAIDQSEIGEATLELKEMAKDSKITKFPRERRTNGYRMVSGRGAEMSAFSRLRRQLSENLRLKKILKYGGSYDIAFFWKQNDSGLYGRRSDMIAKYLMNSGRVRSMVHFDAPVNRKQIHQYISQADEKFAHGRLNQQQLVIRNLYDRQLELFDSTQRADRTYVEPHPNGRYFVGTSAFADKSYSNYVKRMLAERGMRPETTIAWFCPVVWEAPRLIEELKFGAVISDLIDDQRAWSIQNETFYRKLERNYEELLGKSDVVFSNCESLAKAFVDHTKEVHVVPNAAENLIGRGQKGESRFQFPDKPIVGYVGNLRDRIDWILLHKVVKSLPDFHFVFMGPEGDSKNAQSLARHSNVEMLGVVPYDEMVSCLSSLDVAIVPHLDNHLTAKMNPLKVYNYFAAGVPVVSTEVANLASFGSGLVVAQSSEEFVTAIKAALNNRMNTGTAEWRNRMRSISWSDRIDTILDVMDVTIGGAATGNHKKQALNIR